MALTSIQLIDYAGMGFLAASGAIAAAVRRAAVFVEPARVLPETRRIDRCGTRPSWRSGHEGAAAWEGMPFHDNRGGRMPAKGHAEWKGDLPDGVVRIDAPTPVERHRETVAAIKAGSPLELPDRLSLFGYTRLAVTELELVAAVAEVREVHLWLPVPSPASWRTLSPTITASDEDTSTSFKAASKIDRKSVV